MFSKLVLFCIFLNVYNSRCHKLLFKPFSDILKDAPAINHWALLVAGSDTWDNYRHQADICHAYQILRNHGMPAERIITMMVDDIAYNELNPFPGTIINKPGGPNVYEGVVIDYKGTDVNPENFLAVLRGDEEALSGKGSGKVIKGGPNDHIFVNFVDHGGPAHICFPTKTLHRSVLLKTIEEMVEDKKFGQMVIYLEACYSGSMFKNLSADLNVYALTAANEHEPSYSCFYDEARESYIGDLFSVTWMQDSEVKHHDVDTLDEQYKIVKMKTNQSHVMQFGDMAITKETLDEFQGKKNVDKVAARIISLPEPTDVIPSDDVSLAVLYRRLVNSKDPLKRNEIQTKIKKHIQKRDAVDETVRNIVHSVVSRTNLDAKKMLSGRHSVTSYQCYEQVVEIFHEHCFETTRDGYVGKSLWKLVNLCEEGIPGDLIAGNILAVCNT